MRKGVRGAIALYNECETNNYKFYIDNQHPILLKKYLSKEISAETLIIINHIQRYFGYWSKNMKNDPIWNEQKNKLLKLTPFVEYNDKYKGMLIEQFRR